MDEIARHLRLLTGAEATLVVNNNAAAVFLVLAALCPGRDVIVSRGEAIEIGGGFRIPDVVSQSGCRLVEVGTTNRTYASDHARAFTDDTGAILRVHPSNFRLEGFTANPTTAELAAVALEHESILIEDLGSGALLDTTQFGLRHEPTVGQAIADGAAIVTFSGDKLLGGPQAGIICGRQDLIGAIERHPMARAVRADKVTLAGLNATLRHYLSGDAARDIPIWSMIGSPLSDLSARAETIRGASSATIESSIASIGGGSLPGETLPSVALSLGGINADELAHHLRTGNPRVFPIIRGEKVLIDLRTVLPEQDEPLARRIVEVID
jgi:L-seryl-tRNA(Ser) seleniumtransferase